MTTQQNRWDDTSNRDLGAAIVLAFELDKPGSIPWDNVERNMRSAGYNYTKCALM
jgi:hypothetical protein